MLTVKDERKNVDSFVCVTFDCGYSMVRPEMKIKDLYKEVENEGGKISEYEQICPKCKCNSLVYENYPL